MSYVSLFLKSYFIQPLLQGFGCFSVLIKFTGYLSIQQQI